MNHEEEKNKYNINSLIKSMKLFEILVNLGEVSINELSVKSGLGKSTVHRILGTLKFLGYVEQDKESEKYYSTIKIFELGNKVANRIPLKKIARPYMEELFEKCHETVNLAIIDGLQIIFLDKIITKEPLRIELEVGGRVPIYCSALGKAIAAYRENEIAFDKINFQKLTDSTIVSIEGLKNEFACIREKGYAVDNEEYIKGLVCIAYPILNSSQGAEAAISIATPTMRLSHEKKQEYIGLLQETVGKIRSSALHFE